MLRPLGNTGLHVSTLGLGGGPIGDAQVDDDRAIALIQAALEHGITLFDTAPSYGASEVRLGRALEADRGDVVLSTKVGYGVEGHEDWTGACIRAGVQRAMTRLRTDHIDIVHLHSCPAHVIRREDVLRAVEDIAASGDVGVMGYAGEEDDLHVALETGLFRVVQRSVSPWDQRGIRGRPAHGVGVLAKRTLANACWRTLPEGASPDRVEYRRRHDVMAIERDDWADVSVRFTAFAPGVSSALVGTSSIAHLDAAVQSVAKGPLDSKLRASLEQRFDDVGSDWPGVI